MHRLTTRPTVALVATMLFLSGCHEWVAVNADEAAAASASFGAPTHPESVVVKGIGGKRVELQSDFDARVTLKNGEVVVFRHPVRIESAGDALLFVSPPGSSALIPRDDIKAVEAYRSTPGAGLAIGLFCGAAGAAIVGLLIVNWVKSFSPLAGARIGLGQ